MPTSVPNFTEGEVVRVVHEHIRGLFPKTCGNCHKIYPTYREFLLQTEPVGDPVSYDIELGDMKPSDDSGNLSLANCVCGNTMSLGSRGMPLKNLWGVLKWVENETARQEKPTHLILNYLREEVRKQELNRGKV